MVTDLPFTALSIPLVWANNGDSISREYAGTSALKGDFTRTGKRNVTGMMNDASNSLTRMYHNTIRDFWRQATVDFILGRGIIWMKCNRRKYTNTSTCLQDITRLRSL